MRLRLSRRKGYSLQAASAQINGLPAVKVDRSTHFGNPFVVGRDGTAAKCVELYQYTLAGYIAVAQGPEIAELLRCRHLIETTLGSLEGKNLACWCRLDKPCHADVLLRIANGGQIFADGD